MFRMPQLGGSSPFLTQALAWSFLYDVGIMAPLAGAIIAPARNFPPPAGALHWVVRSMAIAGDVGLTRSGRMYRP
jgi:hypothetical protein